MHWNSKLHGSVKWSVENHDRMAERLRVQVWVNGFQQLPGLLEPMQSDEPVRQFSVPIMLNQQQDNHIEVKLPDLKDDDASPMDFFVGCEQPQLEQRLHVVIVGVGVAPENKGGAGGTLFDSDGGSARREARALV